MRKALIVLISHLSVCAVGTSDLCSVQFLNRRFTLNGPIRFAASAEEIATVQNGTIFRLEPDWETRQFSGIRLREAIASTVISPRATILPDTFSLVEYAADPLGQKSALPFNNLFQPLYLATIAGLADLRIIATGYHSWEAIVSHTISPPKMTGVRVTAVAFSQSRGVLFVGLTGQLPENETSTYPIRAYIVSYTLDGNQLIDERILWESESYAIIRSLSLSSDNKIAVAIEGLDNSRVLSMDGKTLYHLPTKPRTLESSRWKDLSPSAVTHSPDGEKLAVFFGDGAVGIFDNISGHEDHLLLPEIGPDAIGPSDDPTKYKYATGAFSSSGDLFAAATYSRVIYLWETRTWKLVRVIDASGLPYGAVFQGVEAHFPIAIAFSPNEARVGAIFGSDLMQFQFKNQ